MASNSFTKKRPLNRRPSVCTSPPPGFKKVCRIDAAPRTGTPGTNRTVNYQINSPKYAGGYKFNFRLYVTEDPIVPAEGTLINTTELGASQWAPNNPGVQEVTIVIEDQLGKFVCGSSALVEVTPAGP